MLVRLFRSQFALLTQFPRCLELPIGEASLMRALDPVRGVHACGQKAEHRRLTAIIDPTEPLWASLFELGRDALVREHEPLGHVLKLRSAVLEAVPLLRHPPQGRRRTEQAHQ